MLRIAIPCAALALLAGCSVLTPEALTFDPAHPPPREVLPMQEVVALTERAAQLQLERNAIRTRIAAEPDIWVRQGLYGDLHSVGMELSPIERRLGTVAASR